jgi:hypothetical protein
MTGRVARAIGAALPAAIAIALGLALPCASAAAQSLTLSPAVVPLGGRPGQSTTQELRLHNGTGQALDFALVARDVVVRDGARALVDAGSVRGSIAATAVFSAATVRVAPGEERRVRVTLTLPPQLAGRAVMIVFQGTTRVAGSATLSLGSLVTFDLAGRQSVAIGELVAAPPTASANARIALAVVNDGSEPVIARGAAAIVSSGGALVGKLALGAHRLLPGERGALEADYAGGLPSGRYRVIATVEAARGAWTRSAELAVP